MLDLTFGTGGFTTVDFAGGRDYGQAVALQADGGAIVAGRTLVGTNENFGVIRLDPTGALDTNFGAGGKVTLDVASYERIMGVAVQPDDKIVVVGHAHVGGVWSILLVRLEADGSLDTGFGSGGVVLTAPASGGLYGFAVSVLTDGRILVGGHYYAGSGHFMVARYLSDGTLDTSFGTNGWSYTGFGSQSYAKAIAVMSDGRIVLAGDGYAGSYMDMAVVRYLADGVLDTSFGTDGKVTVAVGSYDDRVNSVAVRADGRIMLAGSGYVGTTQRLALAQLLADGQLDTGFGSGGSVTAPYSSGNALALLPTGEALVATQSGSHAIVLRYTTAGALDAGFGSGGVGTSSRMDPVQAMNGMAVRPDGRIVVAGTVSSSSLENYGVAQLLAEGSPDLSFLRRGWQATDINGYADQGRRLHVLGDGRILVAGHASPGSANKDFALARYDGGGMLDTGFGTNGRVVTDFGGWNDVVYGMAVATDGAVVVAGAASSGSASDFALARYLADGTPDAGFGTNGTVQTDLSGAYDQAYGVGFQSDGKIVVAGFHQVSGVGRLALLRYSSSGTLDGSFGASGVQLHGLGSSSLVGYDLLVLPDDRMIVAGARNSDLFIARFLADGMLDTSFGTDGYSVIDAGGHEQGGRLVVDGAGRYLVVGSASVGTQQGIVARFTADGAVDASFGSGGRVLIDGGPGADYTHDAVVQLDGRIVVAGHGQHPSQYDVLLVRLHADGSLDGTFGSMGVLFTDLMVTSDNVQAATLAGDRLLVAGTADPFNMADFMLAAFTLDQAACTDPETEPLYAGGFTTDTGLQQYTLEVQAPQGLQEVTVYNRHNMVVSSDLYDAAQGGSPLAGYTRTTSADSVIFAYTGSGSAPTQAHVAFTRENTNSTTVRFFMALTDVCSRTVDIDPLFAIGTSAEEDGLPDHVTLEPAGPNPFRQATTLRYALPEASVARLAVYDVLGREVALLAEGPHAAGWHTARLVVERLAAGLYVARLEAAGTLHTQALVLIR